MDTQSSEMNTFVITDLRLLRCPISLTFCYDPVIAEDGNTYERRCIETHFENKQTSPMTNEPIGKNLTSNLILKQIIQNVLENNSNLQTELFGNLVNDAEYIQMEQSENYDISGYAEDGDNGEEGLDLDYGEN